MKKEDLSSLSTQLLEEKYHRTRSIFRFFLGLFIATSLTVFVLISLESRSPFSGVLIGIPACFAGIYNRKVKSFKNELDNRQLAFS